MGKSSDRTSTMLPSPSSTFSLYSDQCKFGISSVKKTWAPGAIVVPEVRMFELQLSVGVCVPVADPLGRTSMLVMVNSDAGSLQNFT